MADVFISYRRSEREQCESISQELQRAGLTVWFDAELEGGQHFPDVIDREVRAAKAVLVLWSRGALQSQWVKAEASIGLAQSKLVSAQLEPVELPVPFNTVHTVNLAQWNGDTSSREWRQMLRPLERLTGRTISSESSASHAEPSALRRAAILPRGVLIGLAAVIGATAIGVLSFNFLNQTDARQETVQSEPEAPVLPPFPGVETAAPGVVIVDYASGQTIFCKSCDVRLTGGSFAKLMTELVVAEQIAAGQLSLDQEVVISENAYRQGQPAGGATMFLNAGDRVSVRDLLRGMIIIQANDAAVALAEAVAGSEAEFAYRMNERALSLGLTSSRFRNATGARPVSQNRAPTTAPSNGQYIGLNDVARISRLLIRDHADIYRWHREQEFQFNNRTQANRNPLLRDFPGVDGLTTSHTEEMGYSYAGSAVVNGQRRIIVITGLSTMAQRREEADVVMRAAFYDIAAAP